MLSEVDNLELPEPKDGKCVICNKQFSSASVAGRHMREQHGPKLQCKFCGIVISRKGNLLKHIAKLHNISNF